MGRRWALIADEACRESGSLVVSIEQDELKWIVCGGSRPATGIELEVGRERIKMAPGLGG